MTEEQAFGSRCNVLLGIEPSPVLVIATVKYVLGCYITVTTFNIGLS